MFTFNRNEQIILLLLCCILIVGIVIRYLDSRDPDSIPNFEVQKSAVPVPEEKTEFERLPGIGPQIAARIVAYREQNGAFKRVEEITKVRGIGAKTLERLRPHLTVSTP